MTEREIFVTQEEKEAVIEEIDQFFDDFTDQPVHTQERIGGEHFPQEFLSKNTDELSLSQQEQFNHIVLFHSRIKPNEPIYIRDIAKNIGISRQTAYRYYHKLQESGENVPATRRRVVQENIAQEKDNIIIFRAAGIKPKIISEVTGASYNAVANITTEARDEGYEFPPVLEPFDVITEEIYTLKHNGLKNREVARKLSLDPTKVGNKVDHMVRTGKLPKERNRRSPEFLFELDDKVRILMDEGLSNADIAEQLGESLFSVMNSKSRIKRKKTDY